jgi:L-lysine 6-transaminase
MTHIPEIDPSRVHETLSKYILADGLEPIFDAEKSHGAYLHDARNGREYLDLFSFFATQPVGFNHPKISNPEFKEKMGRLALSRPTLSDVYTTEYAKFVDTFGKIAGHGLFRYFFFVEGGTLGVENALKTAMDWKVRKNLAAGRGEKGTQIIHFLEAFHGRSGYTLSLTNTFDPNKHKHFAKFNWPRVTNPKIRFPQDAKAVVEAVAAEKKAAEEIKKALKDNPHDIAALILEPIQAEGGDNHFRPEFFKELRQLADENDFLLIFDEVQTGLGLTGKVWCFEHFGVQPDLIAFGKKAQIAGFASTGRVDEVRENVFHTSSRLNSTWGGNLIDMVRCQRYLEILDEEKLLENATNVGAYFQSKLQEWAKERPRISNVRGRGLLAAFDLPDTQTRNKLRDEIYKNGAIILGCGSKTLRLRPHLTFSREDVDQAIGIFEKSELSI